ncbi:MAG: TauD/TfdA family dioxygenase [Verrucomicrobia subdivision 3 bacterium]|nr:TauD/TfdA family dioxygenase [Limisphaerales bacterium]
MKATISNSIIDHPGLWRGEELWRRDDWEVRLSDDELRQLESAAANCANIEVEAIGPDDFVLSDLTGRLEAMQRRLEDGAGFAFVRGLPANWLDEGQLRRMFWGIALHLGSAVSQSAEGDRLFSVADAGYAPEDARSRGPNTSRKLSFHTDRCDVIGFCCHRQAKSGGENYVVNSMAIYNAILKQRPDLLAVLREPFYYLRHTVDGGNDRSWCRQPIFSFCEGHFAANLLRVLIDRAHTHPDLPDLTPEQTEALDLVESLASDPALHATFRQEPGDMVFLNNWVTLHKRSAFEDWPEPERRRHILRIWLSMPNSRPLDPMFADNYGSVEAGALRGGMKAKMEN